jgi:hypothetical protein
VEGFYVKRGDFYLFVMKQMQAAHRQGDGWGEEFDASMIKKYL